MTAPTLREYQQRGLADITKAFRAGNRRVCYTLPTGGGKTHTFAYLATKSAARLKRVLIVVHRAELLEQVSQALTMHGCHHGIIQSGYPADHFALVQVASLQTLVNRFDLYPQFDVIIFDECHHGVAGQWKAVAENYNQSLILGVTATPIRLDGKGLANAFDVLVKGPSMQELIDLGFLIKPRIIQPSSIDLQGVTSRGGDFSKSELAALMDRPTIYGDTLNLWREHAAGMPTVAFCSNVEHAEHTAAMFDANGIPSYSIDGKLNKEERKRRIQMFKSGQITVLASCDLISEGFDLPGIYAAILLRPTKSLGLYLQQVGRALRPAPGKKQAIIIDQAGNTDRHGPPWWDHDWQLTTDKMKMDVPIISTCSKCYSIFPAGMKACPMCGSDQYRFNKAPRRGPEHKTDVTMEELTPEREQQMRWAKMPLNRALKKIKTMEELKSFARAKGYKPGFVYHKSKELGLRK